jgi:hypothetical protein
MVEREYNPDDSNSDTHEEKTLTSIHTEMFFSRLQYGYEFMPNYQRLVITPLTEKAFQSIFLAMSF